MIVDINEYSTPINKTAALVTQQGSYKETEFIRLCREKEDLISAISRTRMRILDLIGDERKKEKKRLIELNDEMYQVKIKIKECNNHKKTTIDSLIIRECHRRFSADEWEDIVSIAKQKFRAQEV